LFLGHFAAGLGAKALAPRVPLGTLFLAAQLLDLAWPTLLLLGVERVKIAPGITAVTPLDFEEYPVTHSLLAAMFWASAFGVGYHALRKHSRGAAVLGALVLSHWLLDLVAHRPDLPIYPGSEKFGLGLWNSVGWTMAVELGLFAAGVFYYLRVTRALDRTGVWAFWGLVAFLVAIQIANVYGPPPPSEAAIAWVGHAQWLLVLWGYWIDKHRAEKGPDPFSDSRENPDVLDRAAP
jgi:hypothetical protein